MSSTDVGAATRPPVAAWFLPEVHAIAKRGLLWAVLYGLFARGSRGGCTILTDGVWDDAAAAPTETVCYTATLGPSPLVWLAMAVVFVVALGRVQRTADAPSVSRTLLRTSRALPLIALGSAVIGFWWFFTLPESAFVSGAFAPWVDVTVDVHPAGDG